MSVFSSVAYTPEKNPSLVAKQLFTDPSGSASCPTSSAAIPSLAATYSSPSMAKTAVVNMATPAFSTKVDATPAVSGKPKAPQRGGTPGAIGRPGVAQPANRHPQMNGEGFPTQGMLPPQPRVMPLSTGANNGTAPHYSPFNNLFSQATDGILGGTKKEDAEAKKNFASVAASGLSTAYNIAVSSAASLTAVSELDPSKAPGYKAPGQRAVPDTEVAKAPGYRVHYMAPAVNNQPQPDTFTGQHPAFIGVQGIPVEYGRYRGPIPPQYAAQMELAKPGGFMKPVSPSPSTPADQSPRGSRGSLRIDEEYSSPHTPMTLPKIESNLNPNAPNFMSRTGQLASLHTPPPTTPPLQMGPSIHPAFRPSYPAPSQVSQHSTTQQQQQQGVSNSQINNPQVPQPGLPIGDLQALLVANHTGLLGPGVTNMARTGSPLTVQSRGAPVGTKGKYCVSVKTASFGTKAYKIVCTQNGFKCETFVTSKI